MTGVGPCMPNLGWGARGMVVLVLQPAVFAYAGMICGDLTATLSFERNMLDTFFFKAPDIGQPTSVKVGTCCRAPI